MSNKKAVVVGINIYKTSTNNLPSCVNDSNKFSDLLSDSYGFSPSDIRKLQDKEANLANINKELTWLFQDAEIDDHLVFYYSGHGFRTEKDGVFKECLVTSDEEFLFDDKLSPSTQSLPPGILSIILDSCYSGGMEKAFFVAIPGEKPFRIKTWYPPHHELNKTIAAEDNKHLDYQPFGHPVLKSHLSFTELAVSNRLKSLSFEPNDKQVNGLLMSACKADEKATASTPQTDGLSAFTFGLIQSIESLGTQISNKTLLNNAKEKLQDIGLTQTPLLIEPVEPQGVGNLSFIIFEPVDKSIVFTDQKTRVISDKKEVCQKLIKGMTYPEQISYSTTTLKQLLSDLQPFNRQWLTYNSGEICSWSADIKGQQWGTTLCSIQPGGDRAYPTIVEELSKAIEVARKTDILINPYTQDAVERIMLELSQAMSASAKIPSMLRNISATPPHH